MYRSESRKRIEIACCRVRIASGVQGRRSLVFGFTNTEDVHHREPGIRFTE